VVQFNRASRKVACEPREHGCRITLGLSTDRLQNEVVLRVRRVFPALDYRAPAIILTFIMNGAIFGKAVREPPLNLAVYEYLI
jgi:hypothetical protein